VRLDEAIRVRDGVAATSSPEALSMRLLRPGDPKLGTGQFRSPWCAAQTVVVHVHEDLVAQAQCLTGKVTGMTAL
jgi:hypothetical protein